MYWFSIEVVKKKKKKKVGILAGAHKTQFTVWTDVTSQNRHFIVTDEDNCILHNINTSLARTKTSSQSDNVMSLIFMTINFKLLQAPVVGTKVVLAVI